MMMTKNLRHQLRPALLISDVFKYTQKWLLDSMRMMTGFHSRTAVRLLVMLSCFRVFGPPWCLQLVRCRVVRA